MDTVAFPTGRRDSRWLQRHALVALLVMSFALLAACRGSSDDDKHVKLVRVPAPPAGTVTVGDPPPSLPTVSLTANPATVDANAFSTLTWSSTDATSCSAGGAWSGTKPISGSESVGPVAETSTFTLTCTGPGGSTNRPVTVTVQGGTGTAELSWIPPQTNEDGSPVSLDSFNIYSGDSSTSLQRIATVAADSTTYTATNLPSGTRYFAVTAVSDTGAESVFSNVASKSIF